MFQTWNTDFQMIVSPDLLYLLSFPHSRPFAEETYRP